MHGERNKRAFLLTFQQISIFDVVVEEDENHSFSSNQHSPIAELLLLPLLAADLLSHMFP